MIVSTDDSEIAEVSAAYGASVPVMRTRAADDHTPVSQATIETLQDLAGISMTFDVVVQLFAVCPLRDSRDICDAYDFFIRSEAEFVLSCYAFHWMNPWWAFTKDHRGIAEKLLPGPEKRSQDLPRVFGPTGAIWIARTESLLSAGTFYGPDHRFFEIDWKHAIDIDDPDDLELAAAILSEQREKRSSD